MLNIAIYPNRTKPRATEVLRRIFRFFADKDVHLMLPPEEARLFGCEEFQTENILSQPTDVALSIGGDGTLLGVCRRYSYRSTPICGINIGTLGFMADIELTELERKLQKILDGDYHVENRLLLAGFVKSSAGKFAGDTRFLGHAINDVVVTKSGAARMLYLGLSINNSHLVDYKADGVIIASPTGSTAYSLSAGGPIINPTVKALIVTPICAHTFNMRPIVVAEKDKVHVKLADTNPDVTVTFDGQASYDLLPGDEVIVRKSKAQAHIMKFEDKDYYQILRRKLWNNV